LWHPRQRDAPTTATHHPGMLRELTDLYQIIFVINMIAMSQVSHTELLQCLWDSLTGLL
jgi:hypothetical protein